MFKAEHKHVHQFKMCTCFVLFCKPGKNALSCYKLLLSHDPVTYLFWISFGYLLDYFTFFCGIPWHTMAVFIVFNLGYLRWARHG